MENSVVLRRAYRRFMALLCLVCAFGVGPASDARSADKSAGLELQCQIDTGSAIADSRSWRVELRKAGGEPFRLAWARSGDTVTFKDLAPGIYVACLRDAMGRQSCQSIDLVPASDRESAVFVHKLTPAPVPLNETDAYTVSQRKLSVPPEAARELKRAEEAQYRGDPENVVKHLEKALKIWPDYSDALNNLGAYYHRRQNYGMAIQYFSRVTELDPGYYGGWVNSAASLLSLGRFREALDASRRAHRLRPNDNIVNAHLGLSYYYLRDYRQAKKYLKIALKGDPASAMEPQIYLAHIAMVERQFDSAEDYIKGYMEQHPNSPRAQELELTLKNIRTNDPSPMPALASSP